MYMKEILAVKGRLMVVLHKRVSGLIHEEDVFLIRNLAARVIKGVLCQAFLPPNRSFTASFQKRACLSA